jgi:hypothetical protein
MMREYFRGIIIGSGRKGHSSGSDLIDPSLLLKVSTSCSFSDKLSNSVSFPLVHPHHRQQDQFILVRSHINVWLPLFMNATYQIPCSVVNPCLCDPKHLLNNESQQISEQMLLSDAANQELMCEPSCFPVSCVFSFQHTRI